MKSRQNLIAVVAKKAAEHALRRDANRTTCLSIYQPKARLLTIHLCILLCIGLASCGISNAQSISSYIWHLEFITDLDGNLLFSGPEHGNLDVLDLALRFEKERFTLNDNTSQQEWTGTYSLERVDNSYKLELTFENSEKPVFGVYGIRVYSDNSEKATITLQTNNNILSFVGEDS